EALCRSALDQPAGPHGGAASTPHEQPVRRCPYPTVDASEVDEESRAALTVFAINMAIVIGPTPPGTGVIAAVFGATSSKATSPPSRQPRGAAASSTRLMPTSITTTPSRTCSVRT